MMNMKKISYVVLAASVGISAIAASSAAQPAPPPGIEVTLVWQYMANQSGSSTGNAHAKYFDVVVSNTEWANYYAPAAGHTMDEPGLTSAQRGAIEWLAEHEVAVDTPLTLSPAPITPNGNYLVVTGPGTGKL